MSNRMYEPLAPQPGLLHIPPVGAIPLSNAQVHRIGRNFDAGGTSFHSRAAATLQVVLEHCHVAGIPYRLQGWPGQGYGVQRLDETPLVSGLPDPDPTATVAAMMREDRSFEVVYAPGSGTWVAEAPRPDAAPDADQAGGPSRP